MVSCRILDKFFYSLAILSVTNSRKQRNPEGHEMSWVRDHRTSFDRVSCSVPCVSARNVRGSPVPSRWHVHHSWRLEKWSVNGDIIWYHGDIGIQWDYILYILKYIMCIYLYIHHRTNQLDTIVGSKMVTLLNRKWQMTINEWIWGYLWGTLFSDEPGLVVVSTHVLLQISWTYMDMSNLLRKLSWYFQDKVDIANIWDILKCSYDSLDPQALKLASQNFRRITFLPGYNSCCQFLTKQTQSDNQFLPFKHG